MELQGRTSQAWLNRSTVSPMLDVAEGARCPQCGSARCWRDGIRYTGNGTVQRFLCRNCGYRFSEARGSPSARKVLPPPLFIESSAETHHAGALYKGAIDCTEHNSPEEETKNNQKEFAVTNLTEQWRAAEGGAKPDADLSEELECVEMIDTKSLKSEPSIPNYRQIRAIRANGAKNLDAAEKQTQAAGTSPLDQQTLKGKLLEFEFWMQKQGYKEATVKGRVIKLLILARRGANILDPESVKNTIALQKTWSDGTKANTVDAYTCFLEKEGLTWNPPRYTRQETIPFIPSEAELNMLIGASGKKLGIFLQGLKETAADPGELAAITDKDINKEARTITINQPVKGHRPRILTVSQDLINRLETIADGSGKYFDADQLRRAFLYKKRTTARKLSNPRLLYITFITFRHWRATMEYHRTKDILHVQRFLGHKNIQNTLIYIDLEAKLFNDSNEGFTTRVAHNVGEACGLIEAGFEYVTGEYNDGGKIFRKRK